MTQEQTQLAAELARAARSMFLRGYSFGTAGNLSGRFAGRVLISPTNSSFEDLDEDSFAVLDANGTHLAGPPPSKEWHFHLALYRARPDAEAVIHLHSTYATAVSCLPVLLQGEVLPIFTPYFAMRIPCLPVIPYLRPGDPGLAEGVYDAARKSPVMLLKNHGPITAGRTVREATALSEELEEQCKLFFLLREHGETLTVEQIAELRRRK